MLCNVVRVNDQFRLTEKIKLNFSRLNSRLDFCRHIEKFKFSDFYLNHLYNGFYFCFNDVDYLHYFKSSKH